MKERLILKKVLKHCVAIGTSAILLMSMFAVTASAESWQEATGSLPAGEITT